MKLLVDSAIPFIKGRFPGDVEVIYLPGNEFTRDNLRDADGLIIRTRTRCNSDLLHGSNVKLIATATIGTDHIDTAWCRNHDIKVKNAPGCNAPGVAQYVLSSLLRTGFDPKTNTLGIIGHGNVGSIVALWAGDMGIRTLISDAPKKEAGFIDVEYLPMEEVLTHSDVVTLHVPFTKTGDFPTYKLIGEKEMWLMKPGAVLINTSRGGVTDEKYLKEFLKSGKIRAITDVWENEPDIDPELLSMSMISTPHIAGYSEEGKMRATRMVLEAVEEILGIPTDRHGLECGDTPEKISSRLITESYNPFKDSEALKCNPENFENLRNGYKYRHEPLYSK